jgi:hypothetical protein
LNGRAGDKQVGNERAARCARSGSDSETLATFRAAPGENLTTGSRRHAGAKTVSALTMQVAGLVGTLHCWLSLLSSDFFGGWATAKVASKQAHAGAERRAARVRSDSRSVKRKARPHRQRDRSLGLWITRGPSV